MCRLSCWGKYVSMISVCLPQTLFLLYSQIQNPIAFSRGNPWNVNFQVGLRQNVIPAPLCNDSSVTYHPVVAQLAKPLKVILVFYSLLHKCSEHIPAVHVQHDEGSEGHPVLLG